MNNTDFDIKTKLIKETFNDELNIKYDLFEKEPQMIDDFPEELDIYVTKKISFNISTLPTKHQCLCKRM